MADLRRRKAGPEEDSRQLLFDFSDFAEATNTVQSTPAKPLPVTKRDPSPDIPVFTTGTTNSEQRPITIPVPAAFKPYGAWVDHTRRLTAQERSRLNAQAVALLEKDTASLTEAEKTILRSYSGWGGIQTGNERGVLYDFYTSPPVAHMTWRLLNKLSPLKAGEKILEPSCGTGVFFETAPEGLRLQGVELDTRTAAIASRLHPAVAITQESFEAFHLANREKAVRFDHVIGNVPFGDRSLETAFLDMRQERSLDKYFITRCLDNLAPGGTMALIVHPGVLANKTNEDWRYTIARKAQFLGAVKLNDHSFHHTHSGIQPDIVFFRRHPEDIERRLSALSPEEFRRTVFAGWATRNDQYFETHPAHVMGTISRGTGQWGNDEVVGAVTPEGIEDAINSFSGETPFRAEYEQARLDLSLPETEAVEKHIHLSVEEIAALKNKELAIGTVKTVSDSVYILTDDNRWELAAEENAPLAERIELLHSITTQVKVVRTMMREGENAENYQKVARETLSFYKKHFGEYPKDDTVILRFLKKHPAISGIFEGVINPDADILTTANLYDKNGILIDGHNQAVRALLTLREQMLPGTPATIAKYFPDDVQALTAEMYKNPDIFLAADQSWQLREDFITGNAWEKIDDLSARIKDMPDSPTKAKWEYGRAELEKAAGWIPIEEADFSPHSSWIPESIINSWVQDSDGLNRSEVVNNFKKLSKNDEGKWGVRYLRDREVYSRHGRVEVYEGQWDELALDLVYYLNMQKQRSKYLDTATFNREHNDSFKNYIANHKDYRVELEQKYNRIFNTELSGPVKTYPVYLEGWKEEGKTLRPHQWQSIHHLYRQGKGISALGTGFGKTLAAAGLHTLLTQEGKIRRAWFQVPNNKVKDWVKEIHEVLPDRKIGFVDPEMRGYSNRETRYALYQELANSDYDIILMPESSAGEIQLNAQNDRIITDEVVSKHVAEKGEGKSARKRQQIEDSAERKLENGKTNKTITFEDFGCDAVFVDEAHRYKNLFSSNLSRETGLNDGRQSAKAMALFKKSEYIRRNNNGKNVFLLTATPLTNSPLEYYNMLMYIAPEELEQFHIHTIDGFIKNFATIEEGFTYDWKTGQVGQKKILTGFKNIQTLQSIFFKYTDYQNDPQKINLEKPNSQNKPNVITLNEQQTSVLRIISKELESFINTPKEEREAVFPGQNFLTFYSRMRTASLDIELYNPREYEAWENPKLETLARNARTAFAASGAGQVVFCDRVFSSDGSFDIHQKIKKSLVKAGFKEDEIVIVNGFTKSGGVQSDSQVEKEVSQAVEKFNAGHYKILIGSTACIGEGLNLQENSAALHHFDIPFRPSDFIQRNGRIDRQGNAQDKVELHTYMAAGTIDNYSVALVQRKANWIDQLLKTKSHVFVNPDDENFVDADELLLALTEEWGDTAKADARRQEMARVKAEKILEAQNSQRKEHLAQLSLLRGSLTSVAGDKGSVQYQNRIRKIAIIEKALKSNPTFTRHDIVDKNVPFLYSKSADQIVLKGDFFYSFGKPYEINYLNFKKQEATGRPLRKETPSFKSIYSRYNPPRDENPDRTIPIPKIGHEYNFHYFPRADGMTKEKLVILDKPEFLTINDKAFKEQYYLLHTEQADSDGGYFSLYFYTNEENGKLLIDNSKRYDRKREEIPPLNPFNDEDRIVITNAVRKGIEYQKEYYREQNQETLKTYFPEFYSAMIAGPEKTTQELTGGNILLGGEYGIKANTAQYFMENVRLLAQAPAYTGNPMAAARALIQAADSETCTAIQGTLRSLGCVDNLSTHEIITSWVLPSPGAAGIPQAPERKQPEMAQGR
jgi:hypothetical protein